MTPRLLGAAGVAAGQREVRVLAGDEGDLEHDLFHAHLNLALFVNLKHLAQG